LRTPSQSSSTRCSQNSLFPPSFFVPFFPPFFGGIQWYIPFHHTPSIKSFQSIRFYYFYHRFIWIPSFSYFVIHVFFPNFSSFLMRSIH
jgi:hypothetical protein